jgi:putative two-component system hydrogenase maturation factor HypX/HoxX
VADERHRPLETYRIRELAEMSHDIFDDRHGFAAARHAFVMKQPAAPAGQHDARELARSAGF